jgi:hypothetical protein
MDGILGRSGVRRGAIRHGAVGALVVVTLLGVGACVPSNPAAGVTGVASNKDRLAPLEVDTFLDATCPAGTRILSGGGRVIATSDALSHLQILGLEPAWPDDRTERTRVAVRDFWSGPYTTRSSAICGEVTGWEKLTNETMVSALLTSGSLTLTCPGQKKVVGIGGATIRLNYDLTFNSFRLVGLEPAADLASATVTVAAPALNGSFTTLAATVICIDPLPGMVLVSATSNADQNDKTMSVDCPQGTNLRGIGGAITGAPQGHLTRLDAVNLNAVAVNTARIEAIHDATLTAPAADWAVRVDAICAT